MGRYIREAEFVDAMSTFYSAADPQPPQHVIWTGDFMMLAKHDVPCPVCFDRKAMLERGVTPGRFYQQFRPCEQCEAEGWRLTKLPLWASRLLDWIADARR